VDPLLHIALPLGLIALAVALARRELRHFREAAEVGTDVFLYTRGRLWRRMTGIAILVALAATLALFGAWPPRTPRGLSIYMALLVSEALALVALPLFDLWETARTARPEDLRRQGGRR
jgi:hypothetical protein